MTYREHRPYPGPPPRLRFDHSEKQRDDDPNEERNMWQSRDEHGADAGWTRDRQYSTMGRAGSVPRFDPGNERRYDDAAYDRAVNRGEAWQPRGFERGDYGSGSYGELEPSSHPRVLYRNPTHDQRRGHPGERGVTRSGAESMRPVGAGALGPTGLDRDRLSAQGDQGYAREHGGHAGRGPKGYRRNDERVREDVCDRLGEDDHVDASDIEVRVEQGEVTLEGTVETRQQKRRAEEVASGVHGVEDVHNRVRVRKSALIELKEKLTGQEAPSSGHAGSGTKPTTELGSSEVQDRH